MAPTSRDTTAALALCARAVKAPALHAAAGRLAERVRADGWSFEEYLVVCLHRELATRDAHGSESRLRAARFPARKALEKVDTAVHLFAAQGYDATSVDQIAQTAGVARQTFFNYFPAKEDVVSAWVEQRRQSVLTGLRSASDGDAATRLARGLRTVAALYDSDAETSRPMVRTWIRCGGPVQPGADATADLLADVINAGQATGELRRDLDPTAAAHLLLDVYLGALYRWAATPGHSLQTTLEPPIAVVLNALRARP